MICMEMTFNKLQLTPESDEIQRPQSHEAFCTAS